MKKDIIIGISLTMLLFLCVFVLMLDVHKIFDIITDDTYEQKHKVFVPDTMPKELSPDSIKPIKSYSNGSIIYN